MCKNHHKQGHLKWILLHANLFLTIICPNMAKFTSLNPQSLIISYKAFFPVLSESIFSTQFSS